MGRAGPWTIPGSLPAICQCSLPRDASPSRRTSHLVACVPARARTRPLRLVILGEGEQRRHLERLAEQLGVAADMRMPGYVYNPFAYMARAWLFVSSSASEGFRTPWPRRWRAELGGVDRLSPVGPAEILAAEDSAAWSRSATMRPSRRRSWQRWTTRPAPSRCGCGRGTLAWTPRSSATRRCSVYERDRRETDRAPLCSSPRSAVAGWSA